MIGLRIQLHCRPEILVTQNPLIDLARAMKHTKVAQLLSQNLKKEKTTLKKMEAFSEKVKPNNMMNEEQK